MPAIVDSGDGHAVELGVKFTPTTSGFITGMRYYKSAANTGMHTGSLWSASGQLLATAMFTGEGASGCYNLGTGGGSSVREVIESCRKITGRKIETIEKPRRPGDPPRLIASSKRIKKELGWQPQFESLDAIVESAWKWHQKFPRGYES